jgi:hypothetical protein
MPEQLTRHPDVTLQVLRSAGARCGEGAPQQILTRCPTDRFCKLPGGEVCIYGLDQAAQMTQISPADWQALQQTLPVAAARPPTAGAGDAPPVDGLLVGGTIGLLVGAALGALGVRLRMPR